MTFFRISRAFPAAILAWYGLWQEPDPAAAERELDAAMNENLVFQSAIVQRSGFDVYTYGSFSADLEGKPVVVNDQWLYIAEKKKDWYTAATLAGLQAGRIMVHAMEVEVPNTDWAPAWNSAFAAMSDRLLRAAWKLDHSARLWRIHGSREDAIECLDTMEVQMKIWKQSALYRKAEEKERRAWSELLDGAVDSLADELRK